MTGDLEFRIGKMALGPNDVLVVKINGIVSDATFARVKGHVDIALNGLPVRTLTIDASIDLAVLTAAEIADRAA